MFAKSCAALSICGLVLAGCAITPENAFPEARTIGECQGQYQAAQSRTRQAMANTRQSSQGGLAGAIALGIAGGASESADNTKFLVCLERVGATPEQMRAAVNGRLPVAATPVTTNSGGLAATRQTPARSVQPRATSCPANASVLYGGTQYCVGQ